MQLTSMGVEEAGDSVLRSSSVSSRCAVRIVHETMAKLVPEKVRLVQSIGFGGLLTLPGMKMINKRFSLWLLSKVDTARKAIVIDNHRALAFSATDVNLVLGLPCGGKPVVSRRHPRGSRATLLSSNSFACPPTRTRA